MAEFDGENAKVLQSYSVLEVAMKKYLKLKKSKKSHRGVSYRSRDVTDLSNQSYAIMNSNTQSEFNMGVKSEAIGLLIHKMHCM